MRRFSVLLTILALTLSACEADVSSPGGVERSALLAPDFIARAAAGATDDPRARWLLNRPKAVRESYVREVLDKRGDRDVLAQVWIFRQPPSVRDSYVRDVLEPRLEQP